MADATANPDWVAMDLFSQAEHDEIAQSILVTPDAGLADRVQEAMRRAMASMPRRAIIEASLANRGAIIVVRDLEEACALDNRIAPEHDAHVPIPAQLDGQVIQEPGRRVAKVRL